MAREVVFIADDLGLSDGINEAILHAHRCGALDGACLMMGQPATRSAVARAWEQPSLQIGWHLHLADSRPCTRSEWPWGGSPAKAGFAIGLSVRMRDLVRREIEGQWEAFRQTGLSCGFVSAHHHLHLHPFVRRVLADVLSAGGFDGWVRWGRPRFFSPNPAALFYRALDALLQSRHRGRLPFRLSTTLWGMDRAFRMNVLEILGVLPGLGEGLHEFMFHPRPGGSDPDTNCLLELKNRLASTF